MASPCRITPRSRARAPFAALACLVVVRWHTSRQATRPVTFTKATASETGTDNGVLVFWWGEERRGVVGWAARGGRRSGRGWRGSAKVDVWFKGDCTGCALHVLLRVEHVLANLQQRPTRARVHVETPPSPSRCRLLWITFYKRYPKCSRVRNFIWRCVVCSRR